MHASPFEMHRFAWLAGLFCIRILPVHLFQERVWVFSGWLGSAWLDLAIAMIGLRQLKAPSVVLSLDCGGIAVYIYIYMCEET
jgi:hypothetical protein